MSLLTHWQDICKTLAKSNTRLLAVSKYTSDEAVQLLVDAGQHDFAESRPQNLRNRARMFPNVQWHFIGPLQKNKAKYIAQHAAMWHSLSDLETAQAVAKHIQDKPLPCLIQVNISNEPQKHGVQPHALTELYTQLKRMPELQVIGLMGMAAKGGDARASFQILRKLRDDLQQQDGSVRQLCMGMSGDWEVAVDEGATMVRLGSTLFSDYPMEHKSNTSE